jgi:hypothetical protein
MSQATVVEGQRFSMPNKRQKQGIQGEHIEKTIFQRVK